MQAQLVSHGSKYVLLSARKQLQISYEVAVIG